MRQTTKVKQILLRFTMHLDLDDNEEYTVALTDKVNGELHQWRDGKLPNCIQQAHQHFKSVTRVNRKRHD